MTQRVSARKLKTFQGDLGPHRVEGPYTEANTTNRTVFQEKMVKLGMDPNEIDNLTSNERDQVEKKYKEATKAPWTMNDTLLKNLKESLRELGLPVLPNDVLRQLSEPEVNKIVATRKIKDALIYLRRPVPEVSEMLAMSPQETSTLLAHYKKSQKIIDSTPVEKLVVSEYVSADQIRPILSSYVAKMKAEGKAFSLSSESLLLGSYKSSAKDSKFAPRKAPTKPVSQLCPHPFKKSFVSNDKAWEFISYQHKDDDKIMPYRCPCGAVHIGHPKV